MAEGCTEGKRGGGVEFAPAVHVVIVRRNF